MPSRKQRRRRQKLQRHEYEYVIETEEGEEIPVERLPERDDGRRRRDGEKGEGKADGVPLDRRGRPVQKPTLARVLRRAAIFAPVLAVFVYLTAGEEFGLAGVVFNTLVLLAFFIPFSYLVDVLVYRAVLRRHGRERAERRGR
jgi:hypothetical protein